ncbi:MAG: aspartyl/asparaginyl beta-hydroxylase domain-containing protein [Acidimicrobiales bacterium]
MRDMRAEWRETALEAGEAVLHGFERWLLRSSEVATSPFLEPATFPWVADLEAGWADIRAELDEVMVHRRELPNFQDITPDVGTITADDQWKTFFFFGYGYRSDANCGRCPRTAALLDAVPDLTTAFFSILEPHKHIDEHRGPYRGVLRYHLGLLVPEPAEACGIRVGGEVRHWREGQSLLFDDGYEHTAWNDADGPRAVLFVDVLRPLRRPAAIVNRGLVRAIAVSPFVRDAKRRHERWERRFEQVAPVRRWTSDPGPPRPARALPRAVASSPVVGLGGPPRRPRPHRR